jgi:hypothetical protein
LLKCKMKKEHENERFANQMKRIRSFFILVFILLLPAASMRAAGPQASADYQATIESIDGGGLRASSADYIGDGSFDPGNFVTSADDRQRGGYAGQLNNLPVAAVTNISRTAGLNLLIAFSSLTNNWSDVDGDPVTLSGINLVTTNGVTVRTNGVLILYTNALNVNDQIGYVIIDGQGEKGAGIISITINPFVTGQQTATALTVSNGMVSTTFYGIPGLIYEVQRSTNLVVGIGWVNISTNTVGTNGVINVTDQFLDLGGNLPSSGYYRLGWHP